MNHIRKDIADIIALIQQLKSHCIERVALFDAGGSILYVDDAFPGYSAEARDYFQCKHPAIVAQLDSFFKQSSGVDRKIFRCFVQTNADNDELVSFEVQKLNWQNHHYILLLQRKTDNLFSLNAEIDDLLHKSGLFIFHYNLNTNQFERALHFFSHLALNKYEGFTLQDFTQLVKQPGREALHQILEATINFGTHSSLDVELATEHRSISVSLGILSLSDAWPVERITFVAIDRTESAKWKQDAFTLQLLQKSTGLQLNALRTENDQNSEIAKHIFQFLDHLRNKEVVSLIDTRLDDTVKNIDLIPLFNAVNKLSTVLVAEKQLDKALAYSNLQLTEPVSQKEKLEDICKMLQQGEQAELPSMTAKLGELVQADAVIIYETASKKALWKILAEWKNPTGLLPLNGLPEAYNPALYAEFTRKIATGNFVPYALSSQNSDIDKVEDAQEWLLQEMGFEEVVWMPIAHHGERHWVAEFWYNMPVKKAQLQKLTELGNMLNMPRHIPNAEVYEQEIERLRKELNQKDLLIKEVNHRAKNNLAMVAGLLKIQASTLTDSTARAALKESQARIKSLSLLHEELYKNTNDSQFVRLDNYLSKLINSVSAGFGKNKCALHLSLEPVELSSKKAVTLGLLVNEVLTNAYKHGINNVENAEISVTLTKTGDKLTLTVADNGPGYPPDFNPDKLESLGYTLIREFSEQMCGKWNFYSDNGAKFSITFPIHNS